MAEDKYIATAEDLTSVADAIRSKSGLTGSLAFPDGFVSGISGIAKASYIHRTGRYIPPANLSVLTIPIGGVNRQPVLYVVVADNTSEPSGVISSVTFVNYYGIFNKTFAGSNGSTVYGDYILKFGPNDSPSHQILTSETSIGQYCSTTAITPKSLATNQIFAKNLAYSYFALYSALN